MQSIKILEKTATKTKEKCENCYFELNEEHIYCPKCSQKVAFSYKLRELFSHFLSDYFTFDSKIGRSVLPLLTKPGYLTEQFLDGKREKYIQPLRLFIFLSILFFLLLSLSVNISSDEFTHSLDQSVSDATFGDDFWDRFFGSLLPKLFFVLLPLFALLLSLLYRSKKRYLITHFLFALHFHSTIFFIGILYEVLSLTFAQMGYYVLNSYLLVISFIYLLTYLFRALKAVYKDSWKMTFLKVGILGILYSLLLICSTFMLFALSINY